MVGLRWDGQLDFAQILSLKVLKGKAADGVGVRIVCDRKRQYGVLVQNRKLEDKPGL